MSHEDISLLNVVASLNVPAKDVELEVSQFSSSLLKLEQPEKVPANVVALETSHEDTSLLKLAVVEH